MIARSKAVSRTRPSECYRLSTGLPRRWMRVSSKIRVAGRPNQRRSTAQTPSRGFQKSCRITRLGVWLLQYLWPNCIGGLQSLTVVSSASEVLRIWGKPLADRRSVCDIEACWHVLVKDPAAEGRKCHAMPWRNHWIVLGGGGGCSQILGRPV